MSRVLTGKHVLAIAVASFGTVIGVNVILAVSATATFPGLVVENSYVASQDWNRMHDAQAALGWTAEARFRDGRLTVDLRDQAGAEVEGVALEATIGRPSSALDDRKVMLAAAGGVYAAPIDLAPGIWRVEVHTSRGPDFTHIEHFYVPETR